jgi:predicted amidophosphoribosyltransferase
MVNAVKEKGLTTLVPAMAELLMVSWPNELLSPILVPLPSSPANLKKRGFSHTTLLAKQLSKRAPSASVRELLRSTRSRADQVGLDPKGRAQNMAGAFRAELRAFQNLDRPVVLVDDVLTSGASMDSAIRALAASGIYAAGFCVFVRA